MVSLNENLLYKKETKDSASNGLNYANSTVRTNGN